MVFDFGHLKYFIEFHQIKLPLQKAV